MIATSRIIKGEAAQRGAWPWQITIYKKNLFHCGGTIISPIWAVSAAHCFEADDGKITSNYDVIVGETDRYYFYGQFCTNNEVFLSLKKQPAEVFSKRRCS